MAINNQKNVDKVGSKVKPGALHAELHIAPGKKIGVSKLEAEKAIAKKTGNVTLEKRVNFALNFGHHSK